jgi:hypothetical protein
LATCLNVGGALEKKAEYGRFLGVTLSTRKRRLGTVSLGLDVYGGSHFEKKLRQEELAPKASRT